MCVYLCGSPPTPRCVCVCIGVRIHAACTSARAYACSCLYYRRVHAGMVMYCVLHAACVIEYMRLARILATRVRCLQVVSAHWRVHLLLCCVSAALCVFCTYVQCILYTVQYRYMCVCTEHVVGMLNCWEFWDTVKI